MCCGAAGRVQLYYTSGQKYIMGCFFSSRPAILHYLNMRHWERAPLPRIAPRVGATRQPCRLRLTDGTHTALHRLALERSDWPIIPVTLARPEP